VKATACAAACLPAGFGVAELTGVRPLGGIVLVALAALACLWSDAPAWRLALWGVVLAVLFVASHLLGDVIGTWAAIAVVTLLATLSHFAL
jgi:hypothetical protein